MKISLKKGKDDPGSITCVRDDGTTTWAPLMGAFGPLHDLAHYVVETTLGLENGFYGLLEQGYDISSFERADERPPDLDEGRYSEHVAMALQTQVLGGYAGDRLNELLTAATNSLPAPYRAALPPPVVERLQTRYRELVDRWHALAPGDRLVLEYPPAA